MLLNGMNLQFSTSFINFIAPHQTDVLVYDNTIEHCDSSHILFRAGIFVHTFDNDSPDNKNLKFKGILK